MTTLGFARKYMISLTRKVFATYRKAPPLNANIFRNFFKMQIYTFRINSPPIFYKPTTCARYKKSTNKQTCTKVRHNKMKCKD
jgi:hypothetical protein